MSFILAMEDADNGVAGEVTEVAAAQAETEATAAAAEVAEVADDIGDDIQEATQGVQDADELIDIQAQAEEAIERGDGLSEDAAAMATIAVERIHHRLYGAGRPQRIVPARESFGQTSTRLASTIMVKETISDTLKNFWIAIKTFAQRIWEKIKGFIAKIVGSTKMAGKNIESMIERAKALDPAFVEKEKTLKNESLAKTFSIKGMMNLQTVGEIEKNIQALAALASKISTETNNVVSKLLNQASAPDLNKIVAEMNSFVKTTGSLPQTAGLTAAYDLAVIDSKSTKVGASKSFTTNFGPFANSAVLSTHISETKIGDETIDNISFTFKSAKPKAVAKEAEALDRAGILAVLKSAQTVNDVMVAYKKTAGEFEKVTKSVEKMADTITAALSKAADVSSSAPVARQAKETQRFVSDSLSITNVFSTQALAQMTAFIHGATNYASASLANFGPKK